MTVLLGDRFQHRRIAADIGAIDCEVGGSGPPVLLLHGYPQTRACWHGVAPKLAERFTVVAPDLRGYGRSPKPAPVAGHANYAKRAMALDQVQLMTALGFDRFAVVGHDRGGRVAYRLALDHPDRVSRLAILDIAPTGATFERTTEELAFGTYHWFFLAQPADLPERLIGAHPSYYLRWTLKSWAADGFSFSDKAMNDCVRAFEEPETIRGSCEDYRAGYHVDRLMDRDDLAAGRRIACPVMCLWGSLRKGDGREFDYLGLWRQYADDVTGRGIPCGHFIPEEAPEAVLAEIVPFLE